MRKTHTHYISDMSYKPIDRPCIHILPYAFTEDITDVIIYVKCFRDFFSYFFFLSVAWFGHSQFRSGFACNLFGFDILKYVRESVK